MHRLERTYTGQRSANHDLGSSPTQVGLEFSRTPLLDGLGLELDSDSILIETNAKLHEWSI